MTWCTNRYPGSSSFHRSADGRWGCRRAAPHATRQPKERQHRGAEGGRGTDCRAETGDQDSRRSVSIAPPKAGRGTDCPRRGAPHYRLAASAERMPAEDPVLSTVSGRQIRGGREPDNAHDSSNGTASSHPPAPLGSHRRYSTAAIGSAVGRESAHTACGVLCERRYPA
jgi:hypothetical protein